MVAVDHGVGCRALFPEVHYCLRAHLAEDAGQRCVIGDVQDMGTNGQSSLNLPPADTPIQGSDRDQATQAMVKI